MAVFSHGTKPVDDVLIHPVRRKGDPDVPRDVLMVIVRSDIDSLLASKRARLIAKFDMSYFNIYRIEHDDSGICTIFGPFTGAPHAVMGLEKMVALGARRILITGWCGSLQYDLRIGDLVLPCGAISEEGTSLHYPIGDQQPASSLELNLRLEEALQRHGYLYRTGTMWTTDAPFRETRRKIEAYRKQGLLAVDMEIAALMTVAIYRKVDLAGLFLVSDELFGSKWNPGFSSFRFQEASEALSEFMLEFLSEWKD